MVESTIRENSKSRMGIVYVATGERLVMEAMGSADSLRSVMPQIRIAIYTDLPEQCRADFDMVVGIPSATYTSADKIKPLCDPVFKKTVFLNTDNYG